MENIEKKFTPEEFLRYSRQFPLKGIGLRGQEKLKNAKILCVGAGALGSPALLYLAAAGIGTLGIIDGDWVERSNLHRQIIYSTQNINANKPMAAKNRLHEINPNVHIITHYTELTKNNALSIIKPYDIVLDGTDNLKAKYLINDACIILKKPNIYASIYQFEGQCSTFIPEGPCYRCLYPQPPQNAILNCEQAGVLGSLPGILGSLQTTEAIKIILGIGNPLVGRILILDALSMEFFTYQFKKNPQCKMCNSKQKNLLLEEECLDCDKRTNLTRSISINELQILQQQDKKIQLLDVREPDEHKACNIGGKLIPLKNLKDRVEELDKSQQIVIYCRTDKRSREATNLLTSLGFNSVAYLEGGILAWLERTLPMPDSIDTVPLHEIA